MQILKKYAQLIDFIKVFNKYNDANTLVNISDDEYEILMNFASYINDPSYIPNYPQGETGDKGPDGDKGETGDKGPDGDKGETGDKGPQGDKGDTGDKGETGDKGQTGDVGQIDGNIITSNVNGLQIDVVNNMPNDPDENTLYFVV
mgnify:CR=1 FL=1